MSRRCPLDRPDSDGTCSERDDHRWDQIGVEEEVCEGCAEYED